MPERTVPEEQKSNGGHDASRPADPSRVRASMQASATQLRLLVDQLPVVWWTVNDQLKITSGSGTRLTEPPVPANEVVGLTLYDVMQSTDPRHPAIAAHLKALAGDSVTYEVDWRGRTFQSCAAPLRDAAGRVMGAVGVAMDITDHKRTQEELSRATRQLSALQQEVNTLLAAKGRPPKP